MSGNSSQGGYDPAALGGQLGNKLQTEVNKPSFGPSSFVEPSAHTNVGLGTLWGAASNPTFNAGAQGAVSEFADIAAGKRFGMNDPGYATVRQNVADDTMRGVNSTFTNSGRFGSGSHVRDASEGLGSALAGLDYGNFQNDQQRQMSAVPMLGESFGLTQMPGQAQLGVGQAFDAIGSARRAGESEQYYRPRNDLLTALQGFTGSAGAPGMKEQVPWWQQALGAAATGAGIAGSFMR